MFGFGAMHCAALGLIEQVPEMFPERAKAAAVRGEELTRKVNELLLPKPNAGAADSKDDDSRFGVLLYPSHPVLAPVHDWALVRPLNWVYTAIFNALRLPATQVSSPSPSPSFVLSLAPALPTISRFVVFLSLFH